MNETEPPPPELLGLFEAEREAPRVDASERAALRARLAASFSHDVPPDELQRAKDRRGELLRATAQEPVEAPPKSGRAKGKMNIFDKRIIGAATLMAAAIGLLGITAYKRRVDAPAPQRQDLSYGHGPLVDIGRSFSMAPYFSPVAPRTGADLAITAGESAWIHVPFGAVDIEIQSSCNAEVELSLVTEVLMKRGTEKGDASALSTKSNGLLVVGTDSPDGTASTYHLTPGLDLSDGMYEYTSNCVGQPLLRGNVVLDRTNATEPIGSFTNARVYNNMTEQGIRVFGTVLPGARVSIGAKPLALGPADSTGYDPPIYPTFATDVLVSPDHLVTAVRVDDTNGTHFYVIHSSGQKVVKSCAATMTVPKQTAEMLDAQGDHAGAQKAFVTAMAACKPDRDTLSLALTYACKAGDAQAARNYWRKLPPELQRTIEPLCAQHAITRYALDRP